MTLATSLLNLDVNGNYILSPIVGKYTVWLCIETACFYLYMLAAMLYIFVIQMKSACCDATEISDMKKALTDFISYSAYNIAWFAFNFVLCTMPAVCIIIESPEMEEQGKDASYFPILYTLWGMHVIAFIVQIFIYTRAPKVTDHLDANFGKDDNFKLSAEAADASPAGDNVKIGDTRVLPSVSL